MKVFKFFQCNFFIIKYCIFKPFLFLLFVNVSFTQNNTSSVLFNNEVKSICDICNHKTKNLDSDSQILFHKSHELFSQKEADSSYAYVTRLIEENKITNTKVLFVLYTLKGRILNDKFLFDDAVSNLKQAIFYAREIQSPYITNLYAILGRIYLEKEDYLKGINLLEDWKNKYGNEHSENGRIVYHNLGLCYLHVENYIKAETYLMKGLQLNKRYNDTLGLARSSLDIANLNYIQYKDDIALTYFEKGLGYAQKAGDLMTLKNAYFNLSIVEENNENFSKSLFYRKSYEKINDSIWNKDKIWELSKKDKEIAIAIKEEKIKEEENKKKIFTIISVIFLTLLIFGSYLYLKIRTQSKVILKQKEHLTDLNETKDKLFSLLTHDLKTPMYSLNKKLLILNNDEILKNEMPANSSKLLSESYKISKNTTLQIENTLHWILENKDQLIFNIEKLHLKSVFNLVIYNYIPVLDDKKMQLKMDILDSIFVYADLNSLKIILRNLIDNAIKYSYEKGRILINTNIIDKTCEIQIIDYGIGFNPNGSTLNKVNFNGNQNNSSTKLGLRLSKELIKKNEGEFKIISEPKKGTTVSVILKLDE